MMVVFNFKNSHLIYLYIYIYKVSCSILYIFDKDLEFPCNFSRWQVFFDIVYIRNLSCVYLVH
jgi:hypothetical protein